MKLSLNQYEKIMSEAADKLAKAQDEINTLHGQRDRLAGVLERVANSVALGASSKQVHARMRAIFKSIEDECRAALVEL